MRKPVRRIVTGHDEAGKARFDFDESLPLEGPPDGAFLASVIWSTGEVPADNADPSDGARRDVGPILRGGSVIRVCEIGPGYFTPPHRTLSIDYAVVISGELELELDDGAVRRVGGGDVVVQRGTIHAWRNPSKTEWARVVFILIEARPLSVGDKDLGPVDM